MYFNNLRAESDRLCREHGLSVIENPGRTSGSRWLQQAEKRGEPTMYNIIRSDIDNTVLQSMTMKQFHWQLRQMGYVVNDDTNRKYATIRVPGAKYNIRFKTLGEQYTPSAITERILANKQPMIKPRTELQTRHYFMRGNFKSARKITGMQALFLILGYLLGILPKKHENPTRAISPELRTAVRFMQKYSEQIRLVCKHRINTDVELKAFMTDRGKDLGDLERQRGKVYNRMKSIKSPEDLEKLTSERDVLSGDIKTIRRELRLSHDILKRCAEIERQVRAEIKLRAERYDSSINISKDKNINKTKGLSR